MLGTQQMHAHYLAPPPPHPNLSFAPLPSPRPPLLTSPSSPPPRGSPPPHTPLPHPPPPGQCNSHDLSITSCPVKTFFYCSSNRIQHLSGPHKLPLCVQSAPPSPAKGKAPSLSPTPSSLPEASTPPPSSGKSHRLQSSVVKVQPDVPADHNDRWRPQDEGHSRSRDAGKAFRSVEVEGHGRRRGDDSSHKPHDHRGASRDSSRDRGHRERHREDHSRPQRNGNGSTQVVVFSFPTKIAASAPSSKCAIVWSALYWLLVLMYKEAPCVLLQPGAGGAMVMHLPTNTPVLPGLISPCHDLQRTEASPSKDDTRHRERRHQDPGRGG